jgi:hypothetical protein
MSESMRETAVTITTQRQLRKSMAELEALNPRSTLLSEYRNLNARARRELRAIRERVELVLRRATITEAERKAASEYLQLIALVESEFASDVGTAH